ncbi:MAG TPA: FUSC family protein [Acidimicrobiales bacterium]|nr:FUSC family protein [Acidimicrobiales bacterium]
MPVEPQPPEPSVAASGVASWPRRAGDWLARRDPGLRATKKSVRAAVFVPLAFAVAEYGTANPQTPLFASFGAVAFLLFADFGGTPVVRLRANLMLFLTGAVFITLGTLASLHPVVAVVAMGVVAFVVLFAGVTSPQVAVGSTAALLTFILPVAVPAAPSAVPDRLLGWVLAAAFAIPALFLLWPGRWNDPLRRGIARAARALADLASAHAEGRFDGAGRDRAEAELGALRRQFEATPYRPTGAGPSDVAVSMLVGRLEWVGANAVERPQAGPDALAAPEVRRANAAVSEVLTDIAAVVDGEGGQAGDPSTDALAGAVVRLQRALTAATAAAVDGFMAAARPSPETTHDPTALRPASTSLVDEIDPSFRTRWLALATEMAAELAEQAGGQMGRYDLRSVITRARAFLENAGRIAAAELHPRSAWLRNSLRGAIGLALAVAVVEVTSVQHGFWVVLAVLSVLRSNALGTGSTVLRALAGTVAGVIVGSVVLVVVGHHTQVLWIVLPVVVLAAGLAPSLVSFAAGQAGFTVLVVILFNIIEPAGWRVGLVRIEDIAIGCGVALVTGLLFWPRGAAAQLGRALGDAFSDAAAYFGAEVERITSRADAPALSEQRAAVRSARRLESAFRQYVAERGAKPAALHDVTGLVSGAARVRLAAESLAQLPTSEEDPGREPEAVRKAARELSRCCDLTTDWFAAFGHALAGRHAVAPAPPDGHDELHELLLRAFDAAREAGRPCDLHLTLRMLWADERLEDTASLQEALAETADRMVAADRPAPQP